MNITAGAVPSLTIANRAILNLDSAIILNCLISNASSGYRKFTTNAGYSVTSGKSLYVVAMQIIKLNSTDQDSVVLGYCDNDCGLNGGTPTNPIYAGTGSSTSQVLYQYISATDTTIREIPLGPFIVPQGKFLFSSKGGGSQTSKLTIFGYEA